MRQFVMDEMLNNIALELGDGLYSIVFDGSKANFLIEACISTGVARCPPAAFVSNH